MALCQRGSPCTLVLHHGITGVPAVRWAGEWAQERQGTLLYLKRKDSNLSLVLGAELFSHTVALAIGAPFAQWSQSANFCMAELSFKEGKKYINTLTDRLTCDFHFCLLQSFMESLLCV